LDELLRLPLDRIVTEAQQIAQRSEGPLRSDYAAYASDIMAASRHLLDVLHSMSAGAREEKSPQEETRIDLVALALEAAGLVQAQATDADVSLELEGETSLPSHGDPRAVTQILVNLIGNAVRYSPTQGTVRITASRGQRANICVADEGPGVAPTDRQRIFEPFEQAASSNGGAGLGLAISRRLARSMGGDILLDSLPGQGARFTLSLPLA
jgi:signal transduction histidine kinase